MADYRRLVPKVVKLETKIRDRLEHLGELKNRSPHWLMKEAILKYLEQEEYNEQLKQETLARWQEAEKGKVVSHEAVTKWLNSWGTEEEDERPSCGS